MTRRGWLVLATILTAVMWLTLPDPLFEIAAVFAVVVSSLVATAYWYERAQHYYSDATWIATDLAAANARLAEVLDEHSRCPAPVQVVNLATGGPISGPVAIVGDASCVIPIQRKGKS
jgi:hypothetical protein